jgi:hypothetical protein
VVKWLILTKLLMVEAAQSSLGFMQVPASSIDRLRSSLARVDEVRLAVLSASQYNLIMSVWLRNLTDINRLEGLLENSIQGTRIADRSLVIQIGKHLGRILDEDGRATGTSVPLA